MKLTEIVKDKADFRSVMGDPDYIGYFSDLSGEVTAGKIVSWNGFFWEALTTITDVTLNEPVDGNVSWCKLQPDVYAYVVAQIANGVYADVGYICVGEEVSDYKYMIWPTDGRVYTVGLATGVITGDFDPSTGSDSGLTGDLTRYGSETIVENYLKANQNLKVPSGTETLPSSTPADYLEGAEIAYNLYAETDVTGLVVDGTISGASGTIYMSYEGDFSSLPYGGQMPDGSISQTGFSIDYNVRKAGYTTVAVDLALAGAFKFFVLTPAAGKCAKINDSDSAKNTHVTVDFGLISNNSSYLTDNPYGNGNDTNCFSKVQLSQTGADGTWFTTGQSSSSGTDSAWFGLISEVNGNGVSVVTASNQLFAANQHAGGLTTRTVSAQASTAYCRVIVYYQGAK